MACQCDDVLTKTYAIADQRPLAALSTTGAFTTFMVSDS